MTELLELNEIECQYEGQIVISGLNLTLRKGDIGCLLGPSGCGKSTILRAIAGFLPLSKGSISLRGQTISSPDTLWPPEKRKIGMVFQDYALFPHLTVVQNVAFGLHKHPKKAQFQQALKQLELVDLKELANRYPHELSGGQQQRVALARALAPEPDLILLDEPFSNLDAELRKSLSLNVRDILKQLGTTAILVTHDQHEAFAMSDAVGVLKDGIVQQWDTPFNLYHEPANTFIATFIGQGSFIPGKMKNHDTIVTELGEIQGNR
ncbi:MAG: ABC transporter ATP-binding protein, partial [Pseudomonadales bacterium]|nr:ABC transporter ATP-binding protein [Pseudomonadales bacterium]